MNPAIESDLITHAKSDTGEQFKRFVISFQDTLKGVLKIVTDHIGRNLLHLACLYNYKNEDVALYLMEEGLNVDAVDATKHKATPLMYAARNGMVRVIKKALSPSYNQYRVLMQFGQSSNTLLHYALGFGVLQKETFRFTRNHYEICNLIIQRAFQPYPNSGNNIQSALISHCNVNYTNETPLTMALRLGTLDVVKLLVENGAHCDRAEDYSFYDVYCQSCNPSYIDKSIRKPEENEIEDLMNLIPLSCEIATKGIAVAADIMVPVCKTNCDDDTFIQNGCFNKGRLQYRIDWIKKLLPFVSNTSVIPSCKACGEALRISYERGSDEITKILITHGAQIKLYFKYIYINNFQQEIKSKTRGNILHAAVDSYLYSESLLNIDFMEDILLKFGRNLLNETNSDELIPLHYAFQCDKRECKEITILKLKIPSKYHISKAHQSFEQRQMQLVKFLLERHREEPGFDLDQFDNTGYNIIMRAVESSNFLLVSFLIDNHTDPNRRNSNRKNAYDCAKQLENSVADLMRAILIKDTGVRKVDARLIDKSKDLLRKVIDTKQYMNKDNTSISNGDVDVLKKALLTSRKLSNPARKQERMEAQKQVCSSKEIKQEIVKEDNRQSLKRILQDEGLLTEEDNTLMEQKTQDEVVDVLIQTLSDTCRS